MTGTHVGGAVTSREDMVARWGPLVTLRCCRDWPCHLVAATAYGGRCGLCGEIPRLIAEAPK